MTFEHYLCFSLSIEMKSIGEKYFKAGSNMPPCTQIIKDEVNQMTDLTKGIVTEVCS